MYEDRLISAKTVSTSHEVVEADPDVHLELDEKGRIIGIEIWNAPKKEA